jgi:hypothetical protein
MTKSRSALIIAAALGWPGAALALPAAIPGVIAAPPDPLGDVAREMGRRADPACSRDESEADVVVCGRRQRGGGLRIPDEPEPGGRVRLTAGELPTGMAAMNAGGCLRLCSQPVIINVFEAVRAISRGLDRILHPD